MLEFELDILSVDQIMTVLDKNKDNFDTVTLLIQYIYQFKSKIPKEYLYEQLTNLYPIAIKIQILDVLDSLYSMDELDIERIKSEITTEKNLVFIKNYIDFLNGKYQREQKGTVMLQSMFYGDFEDSGKGNNGGLAILLKTLGNEISIDSRIDLVLTITISDTMRKPFMASYKENHLFVRLPAYLDRTVADPFLKKELFIKRFIKNFLVKLNIQPDIFHIRYLDNASMATAKLSKELGKQLVLTLAPDPHRNMTDEEGSLKLLNFNEAELLLNKIKIGDELVLMSDKILGIGGRKVSKELLLYFPQFNYYDMEYKMKMIDEGIKIDKNSSKKDNVDYICELKELVGIDSSFCDQPIILNVGRLAKIKGQVALFKAWANSELKQTHNLLMIGGDLENPNQEEKEIIDFFNQQIKERPELKDKFFHKGALHNDEIRLVEKSIMKKTFDYPHIYLASSMKEEFGIAILEAMSRGFLIFAPIKGGVKSYLTNRENGFLINTFNEKTIAKDTQEILYHSDISNEEFKQIQLAGKDTIEKEFSIDKIAKTFTDTYLTLLGGNEIEV
ncbi:glycosyltransferase family 4 protein [Jeotgalibaca sp. MA1X17-3]|uniref:glycosyltransferase family 4 protein n=1 Tax=Jeotgalibaca sp. MA1X17-3 TaxID=2908211 RepID=UPI001F4499DF|nr:glycosyltransferase family 4 protein [Jeotgalibaca sp. MA1X17-3]UJF16465.1 glycosyltransferase family 4 protein [Jeotgalibaca sp. MA1X17-3]